MMQHEVLQKVGQTGLTLPRVSMTWKCQRNWGKSPKRRKLHQVRWGSWRDEGLSQPRVWWEGWAHSISGCSAWVRTDVWDSSTEEHEWVPNAGIKARFAEGSHHEEMTDNMLSCTYWSWSERSQEWCSTSMHRGSGRVLIWWSWLHTSLGLSPEQAFQLCSPQTRVTSGRNIWHYGAWSQSCRFASHHLMRNIFKKKIRRGRHFHLVCFKNI